MRDDSEKKSDQIVEEEEDEYEFGLDIQGGYGGCTLSLRLSSEFLPTGRDPWGLWRDCYLKLRRSRYKAGYTLNCVPPKVL